jgi:hypothetical protein
MVRTTTLVVIAVMLLPVLAAGLGCSNLTYMSKQVSSQSIITL